MTRLILNMPVTIEPSPKGPEYGRASIKLPIFGLKIFDIPKADAFWVRDQITQLFAAKKVSK